MGNNIAICSNDYNGILLFAYLGEYIYQRYYYIAIVHRNDDVEEKWVVAPEGMTFTKEEIREQIHFQEQYFDSEIVM